MSIYTLKCGIKFEPHSKLRNHSQGKKLSRFRISAHKLEIEISSTY